MNLNALPGSIAPGDAGVLPDAQLPMDDSQLSSAFALLLGARTLPADKDEGKLPPALLSAEDDNTPALSRNPLNPLLAAFSERDGLLAPALLSDTQSPVAAGGDDKTQDKKTDAVLRPAGEEIDAATLQALFAMLPLAVTPAAPIASATGLSLESEQDPAHPAALLSVALNQQPNAAGIPMTPPPKATSPVTEKPLNLDAHTDGPQPIAAPHDQPDAAPLKFSADTQPQAPVNHLMVPPVASPVVATTPSASLVTAPPTPQLNAQLGSPEWQQALNQQVLMFHRNGQQSAELRLHPQELGALQITLKLDDSQAQLHIASAHGQVRAAVEAAMPQLRHALAESGINLGQSSVGGEPTPQWQQPQQQTADDRGRPAYRDSHGESDLAAETLIAPTQLQAMARAVSGVDIFA
ncbi:flagellar hook-length control protein FliK [Serratia plymuthica 4Rx13]|jgi:flagellar hook-length control protein FliK|uniref:Flagellar hook-length control protein FliK n=1 Tax=Serratia plymuthica TaxID=82996 RepID=A0A318P6Z4_SERPL|nr:flagellar hook-length control protein FliK [Serratia plymuthica]AGO55748.1 flagellar hook-length control protein FliK [Serratia plymuthica 4Rx13]PYD40545.1 flagellar hook-length control protein FliK [Serratia plymuthica]